MSRQGEALEAYNDEMIKGFEELCTKRDILQKEIFDDEEEKKKIQDKIKKLNTRLTILNNLLMQKYDARNQYDRTIAESEAEYLRILQSSQGLMSNLKRENILLPQRVPSKEKFHQH